MKLTNKIHRRNFLKALGILSLTPLIQSCDSSLGYWDGGDISDKDRTTKPNVDILLEGTEEEIAQSVQNKHTILQDLYNNPGKEIKIGFLQDRSYNILRLSFVKSNIASYPHLRLINTRTNEIANVIWGRDGLKPTIKFVDNSGNVINKNGKSLEFTINIPTKLAKVNSPSDWIIAGIKIFGVALILWIGFSIAKYVASAIAFLAFNALAIGLVIAGIGIAIEIIQWILGITGITLSDIIEIFHRTISAIVFLMIDIMNYLISYFE